MKKALLYTIRPLEPNEIYARQEMKVEILGKQRNIQIIERFSDIGYPASNIKRPALQELIRYVSDDSARIDMVLFYGMEHFEKDIVRLQYVESIIKRYVKEFLYIHDSMFDEEKNTGESG